MQTLKENDIYVVRLLHGFLEIFTKQTLREQSIWTYNPAWILGGFYKADFEGTKYMNL